MPDSPHTVSDVMTHTAVAVGRHATYDGRVPAVPAGHGWRGSGRPTVIRGGPARGTRAGRSHRGPLGPSCDGGRTKTLELWPHARPLRRSAP